MSLGLIIFSRMSSKRLPGKALRVIGDKTLIEHVIDRSLSVKVSKIILSTSTDKSDDILVDFVKSKYSNIYIYRGSLNNVKLRALKTCDYFNLDTFIRMCGDRPLFDVETVNKLIGIYETNKNFDLITNNFVKTFPNGTIVEIINRDALERSLLKKSTKLENEHITLSFYKNPDKYIIYNYNSEIKYDINQSLTVDDENDLKKIEYILATNKESNNLLKNLYFDKLWNKKIK
jgi:spore coat polysaccharide biosynthesis protein SpsF